MENPPPPNKMQSIQQEVDEQLRFVNSILHQKLCNNIDHLQRRETDTSNESLRSLISRRM